MKNNIKVLDKGFVRLVDHMGSDLSIINSARISLAGMSEAVSLRDEKLVHFLIKNKHGSPFEHCSMTFHVKEPLFVARQHYKHRIGSYVEDSWNEISGRYVELEDEFYIPDAKNIRVQVGKAGAYSYEPADKETAEWFRIRTIQSSKRDMDEYREALAKGICREQARITLPLNLYTQFYWTLNLRSALNFIALRSQAPNEEKAPSQWETRQYGLAIEELVQKLFPISMEAFKDNWRVAP